MTRPALYPGLCARCTRARLIRNERGSRFWLCEAHKTNPDLPKYPPLPVLHCPEFEQIPGQDPGEQPQQDPGPG